MIDIINLQSHNQPWALSCSIYTIILSWRYWPQLIVKMYHLWRTMCWRFLFSWIKHMASGQLTKRLHWTKKKKKCCWTFASSGATKAQSSSFSQDLSQPAASWTGFVVGSSLLLHHMSHRTFLHSTSGKEGMHEVHLLPVRADCAQPNNPLFDFCLCI